METRTSTIDESFHAETVIDARIQDVWPHALNLGAWMTAHDMITVSGACNAEGEIVKVIPKNVDPTIPEKHYHFYKLTRVIPLKQLVLKVYSAEGGSYGEVMLAYDVVTLFAEEGKTRISFDQNGEATGPYMDSATIEERLRGNTKALAETLETYWDNLRKLVAG